MNGPLDVVIPAGGSIDGEYAARAGTTIRALAPLGAARRPVLQVVVDALRASNNVAKIIVVGPADLEARVSGIDQFLSEEAVGPDMPPGGPANVLRGLQVVARNKPVIVCTSDLPFLTSRGVDDFVSRVSGDCDMAAGLVAAYDYNHHYPDGPPSEFVSLVETGPITMGCVFVVQPRVLLDSKQVLALAFDARKSQWNTVKLLGLRVACEFLFKRLSIRSIQSRIERILRCRIDVVRHVFPELACDIDTAEDFGYASDRV